MTMAEALRVIGPPSIDGSPEDELVEFLKFAAEIEHGLMVQYLYAAYSAKQGTVSGPLKLVAIEEMGHLITVQNSAGCSRQATLARPVRLEPVAFCAVPISS